MYLFSVLVKLVFNPAPYLH